MDKEILELQKQLNEQKLVEQEMEKITIDKEVLPVEKEMKELDERPANDDSEQQNELSNLVSNEIKNQYGDSKEKIFKREDMQQLVNEIVERETKSQLGENMLSVLWREHKNTLSKYFLDCEKAKFDYRKKKEKNLVKQQVKADVFNKKVETLKKKYGYLYKEKDKDGNPINFIPSKSYNKYRAFCNWWENTTDGFKKIVKGTLKVLFWVSIAGVIGLVGYKLIMWISSLNIPKIG